MLCERSGIDSGAEFQLPETTPAVGANLMVELEAIEDWLELELGVSLFPSNAGEVPIDLIIKKPFRLSPSLELMIGLGPELQTARRLSGGIELAVDLMFWPTRHVGLWLEPSYRIVFQLRRLMARCHGVGCCSSGSAIQE